MNNIKRILDISETLKEKSLFLFGPRQTGKSTFLKNQLPEKPALLVNLLDSKTFYEFNNKIGLLKEIVQGQNLSGSLIVIDEIQRIPDLLNDVHLLIEEFNIRFLLTGSSARKLKRLGTNLLGGRARLRTFHGFVSAELGIENLNLEKIMYSGTIPPHYFSSQPDEDLHSYVAKYLLEEVSAEGFSRNIPSFGRFLEVSATCNAQLINYTSIASDAGVSRQTVVNYFQILKDTLIGFDLFPYKKSVKRKSVEHHKFYFFDMGVARFLQKMGSIHPKSKDYGDYFEHFIFLELKAYLDYKHPIKELNFWRSLKGEEVDFIVDGKIAVEAKSSENIQAKHLGGLLALQEEKLDISKYIIICNERNKRFMEKENIYIYPWHVFLQELWDERLL